MSRARQPHGTRTGFTLLEVLLAMAIAAVLLAALYTSLYVHLDSTNTGRDVVERATVARSVINRLHADISANLGPVDPKMLGKAGQTEASTLSGAVPTEPETTEPSTDTSGTTPATDAEAMATAVASRVQFNLGIQGTENILVLYVGRLSREQVAEVEGAPAAEHPEGSDLRRITYWLAGGEEAPLGLARQEVKRVTSDDLNFYPPNIPDEELMVIAPQVRAVRFEYFDGSSWVSSWDGTTPGDDGKTPIGPPAAIRITITVGHSVPGVVAAAPGTNGSNGSNQMLRTYVHVVSIPTANSLVQPLVPETPPANPDGSMQQ